MNLPTNWNILCEEARIAPNKDFSNFCEGYEWEEERDIEVDDVEFWWREYIEQLRLEGDK